ncbi:MAG: hypothetical protein NVS9B4_24600 [Candidatus Acidiferrum sp.]
MAIPSQPPRQLERRWAQRYAFCTELEIEWGSALLRARTRDVSTNGMFIETADTLWLGAGFTAQMHLDRRPLKVDCVVKRVEPGRGMGVTVALEKSESRQCYEQFLSTLSNKPR